MAQINTPSRGQPLDVTYISQIVNALNDVTTKVSSATQKNTTIYKRESGGSQSISNYSSRMVAGYANVFNNEPVSQDQVKTYTFQFPNDFMYAPIIVVTPQNLGGNSVGDNVIATIRSVTTSNAEISIKFNKAGNVSLSLNIIIMGIPK